MPWSQYAAYFTHKFWNDHVYEGDPDLAKKDAENIYQRRSREDTEKLEQRREEEDDGTIHEPRDWITNTVLEMDLHAIRCLIGEVMQRQPDYAAGPHKRFTSKGSYAYWERKGQRARRYGPAQFQYGVQQEQSEGAGGLYKIHHFEGVV
jgi:hypothetical protein